MVVVDRSAIAVAGLFSQVMFEYNLRPNGQLREGYFDVTGGEAPAEPQAFFDPRQTMRFGRSLTLPSR